jgi:hypothetical protein
LNLINPFESQPAEITQLVLVQTLRMSGRFQRPDCVRRLARNAGAGLPVSKDGCCTGAHVVRFETSSLRRQDESFACPTDRRHAMHRSINMLESDIAVAIGNRPLLAKPVIGLFNCGKFCGVTCRWIHKYYGFTPDNFYHYFPFELFHRFRCDFITPVIRLLIQWSYFTFLPEIDSAGFPA